jgi:glycosyltransferase involved in cell wall biosynthesis
MTAWEAGRYAALFHVPEGRFVHVPWPLAARADEFPEVGSEIRRGVVASGRNSCDWETLFAAAAGQDWKLTAICGRADLGKVEGLARGTNTRVRCDIPAAEHFSEVAQAAVYAMPLHENMASAGHIRLMTAIAARTPVVASSIAGLDGYLVDTAVTVPSGDHLALRRAIGALLDDEVRRRRIVESAEAAAGRRTWADYIESVRELLRA